MASERIKRQIERLLDSLEEAVEGRDWQLVRQLAEDVLVLDPDNVDAPPYLAAAERALGPKQPEEPSEGIPEQDREVSDTFNTAIDNPSTSPIDISGEEFIEPPPEIAEAMSETFAQARVRVAREEAERAGSNSDSEVLARTVTPVQAVIRAFTHCFDWKGHASRAEFWWYWLFFIVVFAGLAGGMFYLSGILLNNESSYVVTTVLADGYFDGPTLGEYPYIYTALFLVIFIPLVPLTVRRLRDSGQNVWWASLVALGWLTYPISLFVSVNGFAETTNISIAVSVYGCLGLCAIASVNKAPASSVEGIPKDAFLLILRLALGLIIFGLLAYFLLPVLDGIGNIGGDGLKHGALRIWMRMSLLAVMINLSLIPVLIIHRALGPKEANRPG